MSELELVEDPKPAATRPSLLRRLFRAKDIGFYLMIVLAWIGAVYTTYDLDTSRWYWHWLIPIFGAICIITQWHNVEPTLKARSLLVLRQILHWGAVLALAFLLYMLSAGHNNIIDLIDDRQGSFLMTFTVALSTYLAGIYHDWRLCVVAVFVLAGDDQLAFQDDVNFVVGERPGELAALQAHVTHRHGRTIVAGNDIFQAHVGARRGQPFAKRLQADAAARHDLQRRQRRRGRRRGRGRRGRAANFDPGLARHIERLRRDQICLSQHQDARALITQTSNIGSRENLAH